MVDIEAKKAQGKGIGYERWAATFNLKQAAQALNLYVEYGFPSPEELDAAISAAVAAVHDSAAKLKPIESALEEKKELRRQIAIYRATKPVREELARRSSLRKTSSKTKTEQGKHSATLEEPELHAAVTSAMNELVRQRTAKEVLSQCVATLAGKEDSDLTLPVVESRLRFVNSELPE